MDEKKLQEELEGLKKDLDSSTDEKVKAVEGKIPDIKGLQSDLDASKKELKETKETLDKVVKAQDALIAKSKEIQMPGQFQNPFETELLKHENTLKDYRAGNGKGFTINMDRKIAAIMGSAGSASSLTGNYFVPPTLVPGVTALPYEEVHLRSILPVGQTNSNVVRYIQQTGLEGGPTMVAEGVAKPLMEPKLEIKDANVRKIAVYMRVPEEMMDDIPYLSSFLSQIGVQEVMLLEDTQILYGDGNGQNLSGLEDNSTAFAGGTSAVDDANEFDVLRAARKQARLLKRYPSVALVNPGDYYNMTSRKDSTNNYLFLGGGNGINVGVNIDGLRIIDHVGVNPDDFFVIDPRAASIFDRTGLSVRFYDQDQDNAIRNLITIVVEKRLTIAVYYTSGIIFGQFSDAITDLGTAESS